MDIYCHQKRMYPGGNEFNIAYDAKLEGADAGFMGIFADDTVGGILETVSYTHLTRWTQKTFGLLTDSSISIWRLISVSYTHLDVYKRQDLYQYAQASASPQNDPGTSAGVPLQGLYHLSGEWSLRPAETGAAAGR